MESNDQRLVIRYFRVKMSPDESLWSLGPKRSLFGVIFRNREDADNFSPTKRGISDCEERDGGVFYCEISGGEELQQIKSFFNGEEYQHGLPVTINGQRRSPHAALFLSTLEMCGLAEQKEVDTVSTT